MSNKLIAEAISSIRELAEQLSYDESGGSVETYFQGRYMYAPVSMEINETLLRLLVLADKLEADLQGAKRVR